MVTKLKSFLEITNYRTENSSNKNTSLEPWSQPRQEGIPSGAREAPCAPASPAKWQNHTRQHCLCSPRLSTQLLASPDLPWEDQRGPGYDQFTMFILVRPPFLQLSTNENSQGNFKERTREV